MPKPKPLLLTNIGQLITLRGDAPRRGTALADLQIIEDAAVLCIGGKIVSVGSTRDALRDVWIRKNRKKLVEHDCAAKVVLPGFVDSHTHPVFASPRLVDFEKRTAGASYEEIAAAGGGIRSSVEGVRKASMKSLSERVLAALGEMQAHGTTTVEAKSGYGLSTDSELKSLDAIRAAGKRWPGTLVPTLLGAHVVPAERKADPESYVRAIVEQMIPQAAKKKLARYVDVFCERGAFTPEQTRRIFTAARKHRLAVRGHVCQLSPCSLGQFSEHDPASLDHMDWVSDDDIRLLAAKPTIATLVPASNYFLGLDRYPPARKLIDSGVAVALATDFNPGTAPTASMPFVLSVACTHMKMTPAEAVAAATINGAAALEMANRKGSIEPGKDADLAIFDATDYREVPYWFGVNRCAGTVIAGELHPNR